MSTHKTVYLSDLHFEHVSWKKEVDFWKDELEFFKHRLEEVSIRWTDKDVVASIEQFQNQFILHRDVLDSLGKDIKTHEKEISTYASEHPVAINHIHFDDHSSLRDRMETQRTIYGQLKKGFFAFLSNVM